MPRARKHLVSLSTTPYYHVTSRCVRRAYLCGTDQQSGQSYEHRRGWIEDRLQLLTSVFSIRLCAYAIMSNHYHLVVKLDPDTSNDWSDDEVLKRWSRLFKGPLLVQRYCAGDPLGAAERQTVKDTAAVYRTRLGCLSWFMRCLNEPIARQANAEDGCTGHFWEARFYSQPLTSTRALISAMAYVDLNPVRAQMATTLVESDYTSIQTRIRRRRSPRLMPFNSRSPDSQKDQDQTLPMAESDYIDLVEATGQIARTDKRGMIQKPLTPILRRLGLSLHQWLAASQAFEMLYRAGDLQFKQSA